MSMRPGWRSLSFALAAVIGLAFLVLELTRASPAASAPARRAWSNVRSFTIWLDTPNLTRIGRTSFELAVIDYGKYGDTATRWTPAQLETLRHATCERRLLAYLSIGQAEDYRWYWQPGFRPGQPAFIAEPDPDWAGGYFVRYWQPAWQDIVFQYLDTIVDQGFDGVFLDRIDAYRYPYAAGRERAMVDLVRAIAERARARSPLGQDFGVFPLNGEELGRYPEYVAAVTGITREETYVHATNRRVPDDERRAIEAALDVFRLAGKLVLTLDYATRPALVDDTYARASAKGYVPYVTRVALKRLVTSPRHLPVCTPP
jgi:cysteinyl-tRNA synthetase